MPYEVQSVFDRRLGLLPDFFRFVVNCDQVRLTTARSGFTQGDRTTDVFFELVEKAAEKIRAIPGYKSFFETRNKASRREWAEYMERAKTDLRRSKRVLLDGRFLLTEPKGENDVAALLWKLEGAKKLPFHHFETLRYAGKSKGIDLLISLQETPESERLDPVYCELEFRFSNFYKHKHDPAQVTYCICWDFDRVGFPDGRERAVPGKPWKVVVETGEHTIVVYRIKKFPGIVVEGDVEAGGR